MVILPYFGPMGKLNLIFQHERNAILCNIMLSGARRCIIIVSTHVIF